MDWVGAVLAISFLIVIHEAGHFFVARWCSMRVERFSIGFGPAIASWRSKQGTLFQLAPIPFGGFVEIKGMNIAEEYDPTDASAYPNRPAWQRFAAILAGPATNYLGALVLALGLYAVVGVKTHERWWGVDKVAAGFDAATKLHPGDRIIAVDGTPLWARPPVGTSPDADILFSLKDAVNQKAGQPVVFTVVRAGQKVDVEIQPKFRWYRYIVGISYREQFDYVDVGLLGAIGHAFRYPVEQTKVILQGFYLIFSGREEADVKGPVGVAEIIKTAFEIGWISVIELLMMLSVYLGLFNLFPIPGLDGSRLAFLGYEMATRRRPNPRVETAVYMVGFVLLFVLMAVVTFKDCSSLLTR